eukprot:gene6716-7477_t
MGSGRIRIASTSQELVASEQTFNKSFKLAACHSAFCPDLSLFDFASEYRDATKKEDLKKLSGHSLLRVLASNKRCPTLTTAIAHVVAAKPHASDVERLISTYNKLKTLDRASLSSETLRHYLHVSENMVDLESFDPSQAALDWLTSKNRRARHPGKAKQQGLFFRRKRIIDKRKRLK